MNFAEYFPVWHKLTPSQQQILSDAATMRQVKKNTLLRGGEEECLGLLLVLSGQLRAYILSEDGREITIYRLFERDICLFSASCMMNSLQFDITIEAEKDSELWIISPQVYAKVMEESAPLANYTNQIMASRFSEVMWLIERIMWQSFDRRLAEFLLEKGYEVHGLIRRSSISNTGRIDHLIREDKIVLHGGDMTDSTSLVRIIGEVRPDEIYNLGAQSHVQVSFEAPEYAGDVDALGVLRILEAVRMVGLAETCRIYQASTSELYGRVEEVPQNENTPFHPYSPYAVAKQYGFWIVKEYREAYNMFAVNGILFNHESERRGETFVTRKITLAAGRIACGIQDKLYLGNLDSKRDWGYAKDYVECMWLMLQHDKPEDFVIATGVQHTVREFTTLAFHYVGIELEWQGSGIHEKGINKANGKVVVEVSEAFYRPTDVVNLWGDPMKARTVLGWNPQRTSYEELCRLMAEHDLKLAKAEAVVLKETAE